MQPHGYFKYPVHIPSVAVQNTVRDVPLIFASTLFGETIDVYEIGVVASTLPAGGTITADLESVDDDETKADLVAGTVLETLDTDTYVPILTTKTRLNPGQGLNIEITTSDDAVTTAGNLTVFITARIAERSGDV